VVTLWHEFPEISATYRPDAAGGPLILDSLNRPWCGGKLPTRVSVRNAMLGLVIRLSTLFSKS
jgi:hypothetical protein